MANQYIAAQRQYIDAMDVQRQTRDQVSRQDHDTDREFYDRCTDPSMRIRKTGKYRRRWED